MKILQEYTQKISTSKKIISNLVHKNSIKTSKTELLNKSITPNLHASQPAAHK